MSTTPMPSDDCHKATRRAAYLLAVVSALSLGLWGLLLAVWDPARAGNDGIVRLELVGDAEAAAALGVAHVWQGLTVDSLLIVGYVAGLLALVTAIRGYYRLQRMRNDISTLARLVVLGAGVTDLLENAFLLWGTESGYSTSGLAAAAWPAAASMAWAKFTLIAVVAAYVVGGLIARVKSTRAAIQALRDAREPAPVAMTDRMPSHAEAARVTGAGQGARRGIALSGGGIRASSLSLGALQALETDRWQTAKLGWNEVDEVTAISGGSNMAAAWSITRSRRDGEPPAPQAGVQPWSWCEDEGPTPEERHLVDNLGYLLTTQPRGSKAPPDGLSRPVRSPSPALTPPVLATVTTGFLINAAVLLLALWVLVKPAGWGYGQLGQLLGDGTDHDVIEVLAGNTVVVQVAGIWLGVGLVALLLWVTLSKVIAWRWLLHALNGIAYGGLALGMLFAAALVGFPWLMVLVGPLEDGGTSLLSLLGVLGSLLSTVRLLAKPAAKYAPITGGLLFAALVLMLAAYWARLAALNGPVVTVSSWSEAWDVHSVPTWVAGLALFLVIARTASPEWWSLAPFYRGKLRLAYATYRTADGHLQGYRNDDHPDATRQNEPALDAYTVRAEDPRGTPLTVCASATMNTRAVKTHYNIPALSITFDPRHVTMHVPNDFDGSFGEWRCSTRSINQLCESSRIGRITTMLASAAASAALSPAMGRFRIGPTRLLLAFANIRLGVWLPNPRYVDAICHAHGKVRQVGLSYLFKEVFGIHDPSDLFVYVADGGHWENTGMVELLRKGVYREIVCIDAYPGPADAGKSVSESIDLAMLECGAHLHMNLDPLRAKPPTSHAPEYARRSVNVGFFEMANRTVGLLWYARPALTADMPASILAHREKNPDFPRTSTMNQFFDYSTYVAYRNLGRYNGQKIREARNDLRLNINEAAQLRDRNNEDDGTAFRRFRKLKNESWVRQEIVDLIERRTCVPKEQNDLYLAIVQALAEPTPPTTDMQIPRQRPGEPDVELV